MNGSQIREARGWAGYSRRELAGLLGVHPDTVANWETGRTRAPYRLRWHLALLLGEPLPGGYWDGWILRGDTLWSPANQGFKATDLSYLWLTFEMARLYKAQNRSQVVAELSKLPDITLPCQTAFKGPVVPLTVYSQHRAAIAQGNQGPEPARTPEGGAWASEAKNCSAHISTENQRDKLFVYPYV